MNRYPVGNPVLSGQPLINQQTSLLNEMKQNSSRKLSFQAGMIPFSRTPSIEGSVFPNDFHLSRNPSNISNPDISCIAL